MTFGGAHKLFGVNPDMAVFAKALGNGYPIGAILGTSGAMDGANHSFISSTYWTERIGPAAALATLEEMQKHDISEHVGRAGEKVRKILSQASTTHVVHVRESDGFPCFVRWAFQHEKANMLRTLFTQLMLQEGFLAGSAFYPTLAHTDELIERYAIAVDKVFAKLKWLIDQNMLEQTLNGPEAHLGFKRLVS
ncbi:3-aminobutyryl-CoA aminotransferase [bioreactor metagenome]|uniref:3-aminobutyryl-CoA aminotransferase n=1 Tax=bioreactor metagenome TaxID=1076179 RepID=A0A645CXU4_9ZZZZ